MHLAKVWTAIDSLLTILKSDLSDKIKQNFFQALAVSILLYGHITWTLTKGTEKKLDWNYTRMLEATLHKTTAVQPLTSYLKNYLNETNDMLEKQGQTSVTFFYGPLHKTVPVLADQQELIYINSVLIQDVVWKTCWEQLMRERERVSKKSMLSMRLDDD